MMLREIEVALRRKNQLTLPELIAEQLHVEPGDRLILSIDDEHPDTVRLRPVRASYAGILTGVYGNSDEAQAYIEGERASWGE